MLNSTIATIAEGGYEHMSVTRVTSRAGVSRRTFYDLFTDREDCFLAAFEELLEQLVGVAAPAYQRERGWPRKLRGALSSVLGFLDEKPAARRLLIVDALKVGPRVLDRRAEAITQLGLLIHRGGSLAHRSKELPPVMGEGVVGAAVSVMHTRLLQPRPGSMIDLLNPLMAMIVLPYLGSAAAHRELAQRAPEATASLRVTRGSIADPLAGLPIRLTYRTLRVVAAIGEAPGASNREVAEAAGISDQGQVSKLLTRLAGLGLLRNSGGGQLSGAPNAWRLTPRGEELQQASGVQATHLLTQPCDMKVGEL